MTVVATTAPGAEERQTLFQFDAGKAEKLAAVSCALKFIKGGLTYNKTKALPQAAKDIYGLEYNQFIQKLVENSMHRQK